MPKSHKLSPDAKSQMTQLRNEGRTTREIGLMFGVSQSVVTYHTSLSYKAKAKKNAAGYYERNKEKKIAYQKGYAKANRQQISERRDCTPKGHIKHRLSNKLAGDTTAEQVLEAYTAQKHRCAICRVEEKCLVKSLDIDHCHDCNAFRGLLCSACNLGIGKLGDTLEGADSAAQYIAYHEAGKFIRERCTRENAA